MSKNDTFDNLSQEQIIARFLYYNQYNNEPERLSHLGPEERKLRIFADRMATKYWGMMSGEDQMLYKLGKKFEKGKR